jgi:hypothetical protein
VGTLTLLKKCNHTAGHFNHVLNVLHQSVFRVILDLMLANVMLQSLMPRRFDGLMQIQKSALGV